MNTKYDTSVKVVRTAEDSSRGKDDEK